MIVKQEHVLDIVPIGLQPSGPSWATQSISLFSAVSSTGAQAGLRYSYDFSQELSVTGCC